MIKLAKSHLKEEQRSFLALSILESIQEITGYDSEKIVNAFNGKQNKGWLFDEDTG